MYMFWDHSKYARISQTYEFCLHDFMIEFFLTIVLCVCVFVLFFLLNELKRATISVELFDITYILKRY